MEKRDTIYVTGHMHPDTDSIAAAIAYAFFKRAMGIHAVPCRLGKLNAESKYLLERFGFEAPMLLTDARVKLSEIHLDPPTSIHPNTTIFETLRLMQTEGHTYCGVVDDSGRLVGLVTKSDIAEVGLGDTACNVEYLKDVSVENVCKTINGTLIYDDENVTLNGKVSIIPKIETGSLDRYDLKGRIVIMGNHKNAQKQAIRMGAGMLVVVWSDHIDDEVISAAKECHCPIVISGYGATNTTRYIYFAPSVNKIMTTKLVLFKDNELAEDVGAKMMRSRFHVYPVTDMDGKLTGYAARYHIMNSENKKIIMVDHNEFSQSVRAIEKARVLEVIDHHRINDFSSRQPVSFRNEIVGSTATIVATIFRENQIPIPQNLAGLLLGALLSDTMDFHSPTTTDKDRATANILAAMADLDIEEFAKDMFSVSADNEGKSVYEMINQDIKFFDIKDCKVSISQVIVNSTEPLRADSLGIQAALDSFVGKKQLDLSLLAFTSIIENGSVIFYAGNRYAWAQEAFPDKEGEGHCLLEGLMSRKQQILPRITEVIERYS